MPQISFRASDEMKAYVREAATGEGTTESGIMRRLVNDARTSGRFDRSPAPEGELETGGPEGQGAPDVGEPEPDPEPNAKDPAGMDHGQSRSEGGSVPVAPDPADLGGETDGMGSGQGDGRGDEGNPAADDGPGGNEARGEDEPNGSDDSGLFLW